MIDGGRRRQNEKNENMCDLFYQTVENDRKCKLMQSIQGILPLQLLSHICPLFSYRAKETLFLLTFWIWLQCFLNEKLQAN